VDNVRIAYDRGELSGIKRAFKAMDAEALDQAKEASAEIAEMLKDKIIRKAQTRQIAGASARRIAEGARVAKASKIGELSFGFAAQKYSGGATTQQLWPGMEFGSNRFKQFPRRTPRVGRGNKGYFIYPTLTENQRELIAKWEESFDRILKEWDK
jgi:hypothetical protein